MVKVPLKVKRSKKGGDVTSQELQRGEETSRVSIDVVLDTTPIFGPVHPTTIGQ